MLIKKRILIIDDEEEIILLLQNRLIARGYDVETACDGVEGLRALEKSDPDLIILDLGMPRMNGFEFYQKICEGRDRPQYPILILSARTQMKKMFADLHVDGFIAKPFDTVDLLSEVEMILHEHPSKDVRHDFRNIVLIEDDIDAQREIQHELVEAGFKIEAFKDSMNAIEHIVKNPPDVILIQLGLNGLSGDLVVFRLNHIKRIRKIPCLLYSHRTYEHKKPVMDSIAKKSGINLLFEYSRAAELIEALNQLDVKLKGGRG